MEIFDIRLAWPTVISPAGAESPIHRVWIRYAFTRLPRRRHGRQRAILIMCVCIRPRVCRGREHEGIMGSGCHQKTRCHPARRRNMLPNTIPNITTISSTSPGDRSPIEHPPFLLLHMTRHRQHGATWTLKATGRLAKRCPPEAPVTAYAFPCRPHASTTPSAIIRATSSGNNDARRKNIPL